MCLFSFETDITTASCVVQFFSCSHCVSVSVSRTVLTLSAGQNKGFRKGFKRVLTACQVQWLWVVTLTQPCWNVHWFSYRRAHLQIHRWISEHPHTWRRSGQKHITGTKSHKPAQKHQFEKKMLSNWIHITYTTRQKFLNSKICHVF